MFFNFPPLEVGDDADKTEVSFFSSRQTDDGKTTNLDIFNITTGVGTEDEKTTHFGIQGRSDHLAEALGQGNKPKADTPEVEASPA